MAPALKGDGGRQNQFPMNSLQSMSYVLFALVQTRFIIFSEKVFVCKVHNSKTIYDWFSYEGDPEVSGFIAWCFEKSYVRKSIFLLNNPLLQVSDLYTTSYFQWEASNKSKPVVQCRRHQGHICLCRCKVGVTRSLVGAIVFINNTSVSLLRLFKSLRLCRMNQLLLGHNL